jgi:hypothetical protein
MDSPQAKQWMQHSIVKKIADKSSKAKGFDKDEIEGIEKLIPNQLFEAHHLLIAQQH